MKHPTPEDWMALLYGESSPEQKSGMDAHLARCAECRAQVEAWRAGMKALDAWSLPTARRAHGTRRSMAQWAAVALVILGVGFGLGRFSFAASGETRQLRAALASVAAAEDKRAADQQAILASLRELDAKWLALYGTLRKELETVAVLTASGLLDAQEQLTQLATSNQSPEDK